MIRMIATDLDDTLLHTDKSVSAYTLQVLMRCRERGIKVICATARGSTAKAMVPFELFDGRVLMNGALGYADGDLVYQRRISPEIMGPFLRAVDALGIRVVAEIGDVHHANFDVHQKWNMISECVVTDFTALCAPADKLYAVIEHPEQIGQIERALPKELHMHLSKDNLAMIMHCEATKKDAVLAVAKAWGILSAEIMAFGDDANDIDMLSCCGTGVAMGNALESVKRASDAVCGTNDDDGMANYIERALL